MKQSFYWGLLDINLSLHIQRALVKHVLSIRAPAMKTSPQKITALSKVFHDYSVMFMFYKYGETFMTDYIGTNGCQVKENSKERSIHCCGNLKFGHITLPFCRARKRY